MTIKELLTTSTLPRNETEILLSHILGKDRSYLYSYSEKDLSQDFFLKFQEIVNRRLSNEPIQYILNIAHFFGLEFYVDCRVLIPRPETESLIEEALKHVLRNTAKDLGRGFHPFPSKYRIADVGTGSGNIAITLAKHLPNTEIIALDSSLEALDVARLNAEKHNANEIKFLQGHLLEPLKNLELPPQSLDLIVCNLPYISESNYSGLENQVKNYEPRMALVGGLTGMELYNELFEQSQLFLKPGGIILYEVDGRVYRH